MTLVDRCSSCIVAWAIEHERTEAVLQALVDAAPQARFYYSGLFATYRNLVYSLGIHTSMPDKSETFRVEGGNADIRHYLARLARRSRCIHALRRAFTLFVHLYNARQLYHHTFPKYPAHLIDFL